MIKRTRNILLLSGVVMMISLAGRPLFTQIMKVHTYEVHRGNFTATEIISFFSVITLIFVLAVWVLRKAKRSNIKALNQDQNETGIMQTTGKPTKPEVTFSIPDVEDLLYQSPYDQNIDILKTNTKMDKLLIVEDNVEVCDYIRTIFEPDFAVFQAYNGKEGWDLSHTLMPDIIISDVAMPEMNGIALCNNLKMNEKTSHIPVVLLTAHASVEMTIEGLTCGAIELVAKPFSPRVLELKVKNLIKMRKDFRAAYYEVKESEVRAFQPDSVDLQFLEKVHSIIETNMEKADYTVENMCRDIGMSYTQLYRKIKVLTGQTTNEFIRNIRLKRAAKLLQQNQLTVAEITYKVGFTDLQHFRECFKKLFGVTPSQYAQQAVKNTSGNI